MTSISFASYIEPRFKVRPAVWLSALGSALLFFTYVWMASTLLQLKDTPVSAAIVAPKTTAVTTQPSQQSPASTPATTPVTAPAPAVPKCTPVSFGLPTSLSLDGAADGLTVRNDATTYYQIYGTTATGLRSQIQACAPGARGSASAEFTGQTAYTLSWQYNVTNNGGSCTLSNIRVGMHTAVALPYWQPTSTAASGLAVRWQNFANGLAAHEQGHVSLNTLYAAKLVSSLQSLGVMDCGSVNSTVQSLANGASTTLNQANDAYDAQTNHGATQGAVLPTY